MGSKLTIVNENQKLKKEIFDHGFGFPVRLLNVPMVKIRNVWTPNIDYDVLAKALLLKLCSKDSRLTGNQLKFIRLHQGMSLEKFAKNFSVKPATVLQWERMKNNSAAINWSIEKDLRLNSFLRFRKDAVEFMDLYQRLSAFKEKRSCAPELDLGKSSMSKLSI